MTTASTTSTDLVDAAATSALPSGGDGVPIWAYLVEHIDDFAVAKVIVDHFDANPGDLARAPVDEFDLFGVYLRAKVTIKRQQVAYAETRAALEKARAQSRGLRGVARFLADLRAAVMANGSPAVLVACLAAAIWFR